MWDRLAAELDRWHAAGRRATFWWRDDDAVAPTPALDALLATSARHGTPLSLAVIPDGAKPGLADRLAPCDASLRVLQHGFAHRNHAPEGERKAELGDHRAAGAVIEELEAGRARLASLFRDRFVAILVPPWNRIGPGVEAAAGALGYHGLSTYGPRPRGRRHQVNTHIDIIDWAGDRGFAGDDACLEAAIAHLSDRLDGRCDADEPTGLLTHHLVQDEACWHFIDRFVGAIRRHPGATWIDVTDTLGTVAG